MQGFRGKTGRKETIRKAYIILKRNLQKEDGLDSSGSGLVAGYETLGFHESWKILE